MRAVAVLLILMGMASGALADEKSLEFKDVTVNEAQMILGGLSALPWKDVNPLMQKLIKQYQDQLHPPNVSPPPESLPSPPG